MQWQKNIVKWDPGGRNVRPGPGIIAIIACIMIILIIQVLIIIFCFKLGARHYESQRKKARAHLFFNAFWLISHFFLSISCTCAILCIRLGILRKFRECVEIPLGLGAAAAKKLTDRLRCAERKKL